MIVIDAGSPRNAPAAHMQGFLSRDGLAPADLLALGRDEVRGYGVELFDDRVTAIEPGFTLRRSNGPSVRSRTVILASGATDVLPDIPGARERWGRDFLHCPYCHGWEVRDQRIGVLDSVVHAYLLRQWSSDVALFAHSQSITADDKIGLAARDIALVEGQIARLTVADDRLTGVELVDKRVIARDVVFMRPTLRPNGLELIEPLGVAIDESGFPVTDHDGRTTAPGVWAVGNSVNPRAQVITAAGEGSAAAIGVNTELTQDDFAKELA